jgi:hypothetical protein
VPRGKVRAGVRRILTLASLSGWLTKFTDVIGASHAIESSFWKYGQKASMGMKDVAEHGATLQLEEELKEKVRACT